MAEASGVAIEVDGSAIIIREETKAICEYLGLNPLEILGSGSLLASVHPEDAPLSISALNAAGIRAALIGRVVEGRGVWITSANGSRRELLPPERDGVYEVLEEKLGGSRSQ